MVSPYNSEPHIVTILKVQKWNYFHWTALITYIVIYDDAPNEFSEMAGHCDLPLDSIVNL